jgi:branched-chain amino acid transport system substrate-binding protein
VIASYGVETLGKKNWAFVHSTDAFDASGHKLLTAALDKLGVKVAIDQGYPNQSQDFTPVALAIKSSGESGTPRTSRYRFACGRSHSRP